MVVEEEVGFEPRTCEIPQRMSLSQSYCFFFLLLLLLWKCKSASWKTNIMFYSLIWTFAFQERPHFSSRTTKNAGLLRNRPSMIGLQQDACPSRTVPIRRTTKADLIAIRSMSNNIYAQTTKVPNIHVSSLLYILGCMM